MSKPRRFLRNVWKLLMILTMIFVIAHPVSAIMTASQHPPGYGRICFPCHDLLLTPSEYTKKLGNCACHSYPIWNGNHINMAKLDKLHGIGPCIKCHLGPTYSEKDLTPITVHIPHVDVPCYKCHGKNMITLPNSTNCHYCHKGGIHEIHGKILMKICVACHGSIIYKYIGGAKKIIKLNNSTLKASTIQKPKPFSLYDILKSLFVHIIGIFKILYME